MKIRTEPWEDYGIKSRMNRAENEMSVHELRIKNVEIGLKAMMGSSPYNQLSREFIRKQILGNLDECQTCFWYFGTCNHKNAEIEASQNQITRFEIEVRCNSREPMDDENIY